MRVLITGSSGFFGRYLVDELSTKGIDLTLVDRISPDASIENRKFVKCDISASGDYTELLFGVETVVYLSNLAHVEKDIESTEIINANCSITVEFARQCKNQGVKRFVYFSSENVASLSELPSIERMRNPQAWSKLQAELALRKMQAENGKMDVLVVRPSLMYGKNPKGNVARISKLVRMRIPLPIACLPSRKNYIYAGNVSNFISFYLDAELDTAFRVVTLKDSNFTLRELVENINAAINSRALVFCMPKFFLKVMLKLVGKGRLYDSLVDSSLQSIESGDDLFGWIPPITCAEAFKMSFQLKEDDL